jgi:cytochrome c-type biogenesis protein CcmH
MISGRRTANSLDPVGHYRAQLSEIDVDEANGSLDAESARAARLEIQRRILKVASDETGQINHAGEQLPLKFSAMLAACVLIAAFALYYMMGNPTVPAAIPQSIQQAKQQLVEENGSTLGEAMDEVQAHLAENPLDMRGWEVLGRTARSVKDYATAAEAFGVLAQNSPNDTRWRVDELEAYLAHGHGKITPAARLVLAALLQASPNHPAGQYYLGLARLQAGDADGAKAIWTALSDRSAPDAPWMPVVRSQLSALGVGAVGGPPKLTKDDMAMVDQMTESERQDFIQSMMQRLEQRLESSPNDPAGWLMLARSQLAMGDKKVAISTLERGIQAVSPENSRDLQAFLDNLIN